MYQKTKLVSVRICTCAYIFVAKYIIIPFIVRLNNWISFRFRIPQQRPAIVDRVAAEISTSFCSDKRFGGFKSTCDIG